MMARTAWTVVAMAQLHCFQMGHAYHWDQLLKACHFPSLTSTSTSKSTSTSTFTFIFMSSLSCDICWRWLQIFGIGHVLTNLVTSRRLLVCLSHVTYVELVCLNNQLVFLKLKCIPALLSLPSQPQSCIGVCSFQCFLISCFHT